VGFDNDPLSIFENMITFIQNSGVVTAMVGLLNAPPGTKLHKRLKNENRLVTSFSGNNTDISMNFTPIMNPEVLINGYKKILNTIYSPKKYYERVKTFLIDFKPAAQKSVILKLEDLKAFLRSVWILGIRKKGRKYYWKLVGWTLVRRPRSMHLAVTMAIYGFHFRQVVEQLTKGSRPSKNVN
jgi:hypothetical protein